MIRSKLGATGDTTIPEAVRSALGVGSGDELEYILEDGRVILSKVGAADAVESAGDHDAEREIYGDPSRAGC
jgi:bifunctional DNA-binding transcriptional regulator/antitoxin component of YhaV-PrlF toxin-antitoxin module